MNGIALTLEYRSVWLTLARSGGWWTVRQLKLHWTPTFVEWELEALLQALELDGRVMRREMVDGVASYAVTSDCVPIEGFALDGNVLAQQPGGARP
jgi:hypothetical protein